MVYKIPVDAGFSCPNRESASEKFGCIFCSPRGSGDFAGNPNLSIREQLINSHKGIKKLSEKHSINKYIAYFQAYTNTYAPIEELREKYFEAISVPDVVGLAIATRPDCLGPDVIKLLDELSRKTYVWIELGLQSIHEKTATLIRRGYSLSCFEQAVSNLNNIGIDIVCHLIFGLPGENREDMLASVKIISKKNLQGVKIHSLHVLEDTRLAEMYQHNTFDILTKDQYIKIVVDALELLPPNFVIHRMTGDGPKDILIAPKWSENKRDVLDSIRNELLIRDSWQGKLYNGT